MKVSIEAGADVDDFIEAAKKKLTPLLDTYSTAEISISLTEGGTALRPDLKISEISALPGYIENKYELPLFISVLTATALLSDIMKAIKQVSKEKLKLPDQEYLPKGNIVKLKVPIVDGVKDLLYSPAIYNATKTTGITPSSERLKNRNEAHSSPTMLIGVSGCGKTRCCFDIAASQKVIYFDCVKHADFRKFVSSLLHEKDELHQITESRFSLLLYIRYNLLVHLEPISSNEWLRYQLYGKFQDEVSELFHRFQSKPPLLPKIRAQTLIFDECQETLNDLKNRYADGSGLERQRALLSALVRIVYFANYRSYWAGTHLRLKDTSIVASSVGKPEKVIVFTEFNNYSEVDIRKLLQRWIFKEAYQKIPNKLMDQACYLLSGRARFVSSFIAQLAQYSYSKEVGVEQCFSSSLTSIYTMYTSETDESSFFSFWKKYSSLTVNVLSNPQPEDENLVFNILLELVVNYFAGSAIVTRQCEVDLISTALVRIEKQPNATFAYSICEPLPIEAAVNYFSTLKSDPFLRCFERYLFSPDTYSLGFNAQSRGFLFELVLAIRVRLGWWKHIPEEANVWKIFPDWCKEALRELPPPRFIVTQKTLKESPDWCLQNFEEDSDVFVLPDFNFGPDGLYRFMSFNLKSTWSRNSAGLLTVSKKESQKNQNNTKITNWCAKADTQRRKKILDASKIYPGLIHFRIEFPTSNYEFNSSIDGNNATICVDINSEIAKFIFGTDFIEMWQKYISKAIKK